MRKYHKIYSKNEYNKRFMAEKRMRELLRFIHDKIEYYVGRFTKGLFTMVDLVNMFKDFVIIRNRLSHWYGSMFNKKVVKIKLTETNEEEIKKL
jgi:hypothetical protein